MSSSWVVRCRLWLAFVVWIVPAAAVADTVTLAWDPSTGATGYTVRWGTAQGSYPNSADAGASTQYSINGLTAGATYWAVVQAYNSVGISAYSTPLQFTVPLVCTSAITPTGISAPAAGTSGSLTVSTPAGCSWSASSASGALTFQNGTGRTGSGSLTFAVAAHTSTTARTLTGTVAGLTFTVSQAAASCTYSISPAGTSAPAAGTSGSITVTTQAGCAWSASSGNSDLTFQNGTGRTGTGSVTYTVAANTSTTTRSVTGTVAGQTFSVAQAAAACTYAISPASVTSPDTGTSGSITVTTQTGCAWSASSPNGALTFTNGNGRTGSGSVSFAVAANTGTSARTLAGTVAGQAFSVSQAAPAACTYSINPASISVADTAASGTVTVTTAVGCGWSASSAGGILTFQNGTGRSGPGSVTFAMTANTGTTARTAVGTVAGQSFTVTQSAPAQACSYAISPASASAPAAGTTGTITVTTQAGCAWSAATASTFLSFPDGSGRTGSGTVTYVAAPNTSGYRSATATVAGKPFSIAQTGTTCTYSVSPANISRTAAAATGLITVSTQTGCAWSATTTSSFLSFVNGTGRTGPGSVTFSLAENFDAAERNAAGTVAGVTFTVAQAGTASTPPAPLRWSSDFDGDGKNDILVQDSATGAVEAWLLDNTTVKSTLALSDSLDAGWSLAGRGDFNGDGKPDLVWQHRIDGLVSLWYMDGVNRIGFESPSIGQPDPQWKIVGVGDFNADQHADLVWQHEGDGSLSVWLMNGSVVFGTASLVPDRPTDLGWKVVGVADFNIDAKPDLLWRHTGTGAVAAWLMNGLSAIIQAPLSPSTLPDQAWQVGAVADVNGDNKPDIVWQHTDGTIMFWQMNLTTRVTAPVLPMGLPTGWFVVGPK